MSLGFYTNDKWVTKTYIGWLQSQGTHNPLRSSTWTLASLSNRGGLNASHMVVRGPCVKGNIIASLKALGHMNSSIMKHIQCLDNDSQKSPAQDVSKLLIFTSFSLEYRERKGRMTNKAYQ